MKLMRAKHMGQMNDSMWATENWVMENFDELFANPEMQRKYGKRRIN